MSSSCASPFVTAMDSVVPKQLGENGHAEYTWSKNVKEQMTQFYFQLIRLKKEDYEKNNSLTKILNNIIGDLKQKIMVSKEGSGKVEMSCEYFHMLRSMYQLIGHSRDIQNGKGERTAAYLQILAWYDHFPNLAKYAFRTLVQYVNPDYSTNFSKHQYGSWSDVKYFCQYVKYYTENENHELINYAVELMVEQLKYDKEQYIKQLPFSLAARWSPKEKQHASKWIFNKMAFSMFPYTSTAKTPEGYKKAERKANTVLRTQYLSPLNKALDTTQIKMCDPLGRWNQISWNNVTSQTLRKNKNAWQNITKSGTERYPDREDRVECAQNYKDHIQRAVSGDKSAKVHGRVLNTYELVKDAMKINPSNKEQYDQINLQWQDAGEKVSDNLGNIIPMADTSASMISDNCVPFYNSIGLSIRVSEKTNPAFKNRILQFSSTANWFDLSQHTTFVDKVKYMKEHINCASTNFYGAMKLILDSVLQAELPPRQVNNLVLIVFSDMQINADTYGANYDDTLHDTVKKMYESAGLNSKYRTPFEPPHIVFWNLRQTSGFPTTSTEKNVTMVSGYSDTILNAFLDKGIGGLQQFTPYNMFLELVNSDNYGMLSQYFNQYFVPLE